MEKKKNIIRTIIFLIAFIIIGAVVINHYFFQTPKRKAVGIVNITDDKGKVVEKLKLTFTELDNMNHEHAAFETVNKLKDGRVLIYRELYDPDKKKFYLLNHNEYYDNLTQNLCTETSRAIPLYRKRERNLRSLIKNCKEIDREDDFNIYSNYIQWSDIFDIDENYILDLCSTNSSVDTNILLLRFIPDCDYIDKDYFLSIEKKHHYKPGRLNIPRKDFKKLLINDNKVLIIGGKDQNGNLLKSVELYNPRTGKVKIVGEFQNDLPFLKAVKLNDGKVLILPNNIFDPITNKIETYELNETSKDLITATNVQSVTLKDGKVLFFGGLYLAIYDPKTHNYYKIKLQTKKHVPYFYYSLPEVKFVGYRINHNLTLLDNGSVLVIGGVADQHPSSIYSKEAILIDIQKIK